MTQNGCKGQVPMAVAVQLSTFLHYSAKPGHEVKSDRCVVFFSPGLSQEFAEISDGHNGDLQQ